MVTTAQKAVLGGIRPALALDFRGGLLDSRITFTRSSSGTDFDNTGTIVLFSSGTPRFGYDPVSLVPLGLLMEESRTNLFLNSLLNGTNLSTQTVTVAAVQYALSFYGTGTISMTGGFTGSLVGSGAFPTRSVLIFTASAGSLVCTVTGIVQYAQLEATSAFSSCPTSFIPTAGSTVTRSADVADMTSANFTSWYNSSAGTFVTQATPPGNYSQAAYVISANGGSTSNYNSILKANATVSAIGKRWVGVTNVSNSFTNLIAQGVDGAATTARLAYAYMASNFAFAASGALVGKGTSGALPSVNRFDIGSAAGSQQINGHIAYVNYYNTRLPSGKLQQLTS